MLRPLPVDSIVIPGAYLYQLKRAFAFDLKCMGVWMIFMQDIAKYM